ncbi:hypothetical protein WOC76_10830 [Methylocystis sp. IM3]|uniref:hypothetical protein n=1 Tax=unclassified Methylocystis TaxID=2625913 RepID=UPI0031191521
MQATRNGRTLPARNWTRLLLCCVFYAPSPLMAQNPGDDPANHAWQARAIAHAQKMRMFRDMVTGQQPTPKTIPVNRLDFDPSGMIATFQPKGPTQTSENAFFRNLGTNGRTCLTCHAPENGWTISATSVQTRFAVSFGNDPIFRLVDGATCPTADVSSIDAKLNAYSLLLSKGLIRIGLPIPNNAEFSLSVASDDFGCNTDPRTGVATGIVSIYRRPLPSTNLGFLGVDFTSADKRLNPTIMWDGREPSLASQANDATLGHAQANGSPNNDQLNQIVSFETGIFTAQAYDSKAKNLTGANGVAGGPAPLQQQLSEFYPGVNDPIGLNPKGTPFTSLIFKTYASWEGMLGGAGLTSDQAAVARGEALFNNTKFAITKVGGLNDELGIASISGFCGTCHDSPNVGNHSVKMPLNIGVANAPVDLPPGVIDATGLPVFNLACNSGPLAGKTFRTTDPGRALISGKCADIGKFKGPILRGLAARAPYFHNGSASTLLDVVNFYDVRFNIGFSEQQKRDLVAFLKAL